MKYTRKQLIKAMELYHKDSILNPTDYSTDIEGTLGEAQRTIDLLISFIKE